MQSVRLYEKNRKEKKERALERGTREHANPVLEFLFVTREPQK